MPAPSEADAQPCNHYTPFDVLDTAPESLLTVTRFSMLALWLLAVGVVLLQLGRILQKQWGLGARGCRSRCQEVLNVLAHQSVTWTAIRFIILVASVLHRCEPIPSIPFIHRDHTIPALFLYRCYSVTGRTAALLREDHSALLGMLRL